MSSVLTLIAEASAQALDDDLVQRVRLSLTNLGAASGTADWLGDAACDLPFAGLALEQAEAAARREVGDRPVDLVVQPVAGRRKRLLVADMESTVIRQEMLDELAGYVGVKERVADITARAMNGEIDFRDALRERVGLLKGLPATVLDEVWEKAEAMPGAAALVATMRKHGAACILVSGGFKPFTRRVRAWFGFDDDQGNDLEIAEGVLTGRVIEPILDRDSKLAALRGCAGERGLPIEATMSVGDGANDLPMLLAAGLGIAFHAKPSVAAQARSRVDHADLTALLFAQGYRAADFADC